MSTTKGTNCSISSFLSMSCREKAEAFARHLQSRLSSLDRNGDISTVNETSWLGVQDNSNTVSHQPRQTSDLTLDLNGDFFESPGSPEEENAEPIITNDQDSFLIGLNGFKSPEIQNGYSKGDHHNTKANNENEDSLIGSGNVQINNKSSLAVCDSTIPNEDSAKESLAINELTNNTNGLNENTATCNSITDEDTCTYLPTPQAQYASQLVVQEDRGEKVASTEASGSSRTIKEDKTPREEILCINDNEEIYLKTTNLLSVPYSKNEDEDENDSEHVIPRVRRCSSLKTGKTPPGTPRKKKIVHFADVLGLELTKVRSFLDEVPKVPNSAFDDLRGADLNNQTSSPSFLSTGSSSGHYKPEKILCAMFQQPGGQSNFLEKIKEKYVSLENAIVDDPIDLSIKGTIRVRNLDFHKSVHIRYSLDSWKTFADLQATYLKNSCDGFSDKFSFILFAHTLSLGQSIEFAIRYHCKGSQYWDNNYGVNYIFQCLPASKQQVDHLSIENYGENWDPKFYYQNENLDVNLPNVNNYESDLLEDTLLNEQSDYDNETSLFNNNKRHNINNSMVQRGRSDVVTVVVIVLISILYLYIQSNIFS